MRCLIGRGVHGHGGSWIELGGFTKLHTMFRAEQRLFVADGNFQNPTDGILGLRFVFDRGVACIIGGYFHANTAGAGDDLGE